MATVDSNLQEDFTHHLWPDSDALFKELDYAQISSYAHVLADKFPQFVQLYSAGVRYGLSHDNTCVEQDGAGTKCEYLVLHITDHATLKENPERPEVFFSGALHGNERVGPTAVMEAAKLMVFGAACYVDSSAKECTEAVLASSPDMVPWLARLAMTRSTVIMPFPNALGYAKNTRGETGLDPNRDFSYRQDPTACMTTIAARAVNEVWREHAFQLAVTFHGGMVAMAYEWGSLNHPHKMNFDGHWNDISPDHGAQAEVAAGLSRFAGAFEVQGEKYQAYPTGRMNELVYPVSGGMEDWAYAGSWDEGMVQCKPDTYGGYPEEKTRYNSAMLRALNILVETSNNKAPEQNTLGSRKGLLRNMAVTEQDQAANGHIARNVRLSLMVVDLVEPYVRWASPTLEMKQRGGEQAALATTDRNGNVDVEWTVGGAFDVDMTLLSWGKWPVNAESFSVEQWELLFEESTSKRRSSLQSGKAKWGTVADADADGGETPQVAQEGASGREGNTFRYTANLANLVDGVDLSGLTAQGEGGGGGGFAYVVAIAKVDQSWANRSKWDTSPDLPPQSHFVNARTNGAWREANAGHVVRGRAVWLSPPLKVELKIGGDEPAGTDKQTDDDVTKRPVVAPLGADGVDTGGGLEVSEIAFLLGILSAIVLLVFIARRRGLRSGSGSPQARRWGATRRARQSGKQDAAAAATATPGRQTSDSARRRVKTGSADSSGGSGDEKNPFLTTIEEGRA